MTALTPLHQFMSAMDRQIERRRFNPNLTMAELEAMPEADQRAWWKQLIDSWTVGHPTYRGDGVNYSKDATEYLDEMHSDTQEARNKGWNV
jgi:hypothetical protein